MLDRAKQAGELRDDLALSDLAFVIWGISRTVEMTAGFAPRLWRRHLALLLDGFRAEGAHPLPEPPLPSAMSHEGMSHEGMSHGLSAGSSHRSSHGSSHGPERPPR